MPSPDPRKKQKELLDKLDSKQKLTVAEMKYAADLIREYQRASKDSGEIISRMESKNEKLRKEVVRWESKWDLTSNELRKVKQQLEIQLSGQIQR